MFAGDSYWLKRDEPGGLLLVQSEVNLYGASYGAAYHGVVTDAEEAHHFYVSGHRAGTCKLSVGVHAAQGVGHTFGNLTFSIYKVKRNVMVISYICQTE